MTLTERNPLCDRENAMIENQSAADIGQYGYSHYSEKPVTPGQHDLMLVPQSIADGWEALCSCGEWRAFANFREYERKDDLLAALREKHAAHVGPINKALEGE